VECGQHRVTAGMTRKTIDITGTTSPYCLSVVEKEAKALKQSDELFITCDHFPAATTAIPRIAQEQDLVMEVQKPSREYWAIRLARR
jgi:TusA-related sulfurtransferase